MESTSAAGNATWMAAHKVSLTNLKKILSLDGKKTSCQCWKEQLLMVRRTYQLDDNMTKLLLGAKLIGNVEE